MYIVTIIIAILIKYDGQPQHIHGICFSCILDPCHKILGISRRRREAEINDDYCETAKCHN